MKKAAMFGLDARIKKLCHTGLDPVCHALNNKHAAMFGLDARIALAIFGALSVISGAALYSAIQQANTIALVTTLEEAGKAYYAYYIDTGAELPYVDVNANKWDINSAELVESSVAGWKGPYMSLSIDDVAVDTLDIPNYDILFFFKAIDSTWASSAVGELPDAVCDLPANINKPCYIWSVIRAKAGQNIANLGNNLDLYVDGALSSDTGKVRVIGTNFIAMQVGLANNR